MRDVREAISTGSVTQFLTTFFKEQFFGTNVPQWALDACDYLGLEIVV